MRLGTRTILNEKGPRVCLVVGYKEMHLFYFSKFDEH